MAKQSKQKQTRLILVRAVAAHTYGNGLLGIEVEAAELSAEDRAKIRELFPNTESQVHELLDREALLAAAHGISGDFEAGRHEVHSTGLTPPYPTAWDDDKR